jgi:N-acetylglucosaminyl-diphospho-decaprenol L-rhamnosyltransferase
VWVVDHSTEPARAARISEAFSWVNVIPRPDNPGFAAGVNRAAAASAGRFILLLNPDCVLGEAAIPKMAALLDDRRKVAVCGARVHDADGSVQASARHFPDVTTAFGGRTTWLTRWWPGNPLTNRNLVGREANVPIEVDWVSGACTMIRRSAFDAVDGMDEGFFLYWEDADLCLRLKQRGWSTVYHPGAIATHIGGRSSAHARRRSLIAFHRSAFRYFFKHAGSGARLASPLVYFALQLRLFAKVARLEFSRLARR